MNYLTELYGRIHWILTSPDSWFLWFIISVVLCIIIAIVRDVKSKYKNQITYYFIVLIVGSFVLRILLWVFLPSPELIGVVK